MNHYTKITSKNRWRGLQLKEFIAYRDLLYFMVLRDITVLYKQSVLGIMWAIINPVFTMIVFSVVFGRLAGIPSEGVPYPVFSLAGLIPWTYFASALGASGISLVTNAAIFTKVYFPRIIIPLTPVISKLLDFFIGLFFLFGMMIYYGYAIDFKVFFIIPLILMMLLTTAGMGMWLSALSIQYRDIKFALTFLIPVMMYAAPVVFPMSLILDKFGYEVYLLYGCYPMAAVIDGFRAIVIPDKVISIEIMLMGFSSALLFFFGGLFVFKKLEHRFADVA